MPTDPPTPPRPPYHAPFAEQLAFFRQKTNLPTERWDDIRHAAHDRSFIVAGAQAADLLADLNAAVVKAIEQGTGLAAFRQDFQALVARNGWTGWTGEGSKQGVAWRTKVIYQTNMATSYAAGRHQQLTDPDLLAILPYWRYRHADGVLYPRPLHVSWDGLTLPPEHEFWRAHFPPNGWGCHCRVTAASKSDYLRAVANGRGPANAPPAGATAGIDRGFAYTPGASVSDELRALVDAKLPRLPAPIGVDLAADVPQHIADQRSRAFAAWVDAVLSAGMSRNMSAVVGVIRQNELDALAAADQPAPISAEIAVEDRLLVGKKARRHEQQGNALSADEWKSIPVALETDRRVYRDKETGRLLYVLPAPGDDRSIRLVVHVDFVSSRPKRTLNLVRSAFKIDAQALADRRRYDEIR